MREEKEFVIRLHLAAEFADDEDSDDDGHVWLRHWERTKPAVMKAIFQTLRESGTFTAHVQNRGAPSDDEVEIAIELKR